MPNVKITLNDGTTKTVRFEDGFTEADIEEVASQLNANIKPTVEEKKGIGTPYDWANNFNFAKEAALMAPINAIKDKKTLKEAYTDKYNQRQEELKQFEKEHPLASGASRLVSDTLAYTALPMLRANAGAGALAKGGAFLGNAGIQGGIPGLIEGAEQGDALGGAGTGTGVALGVQSLPIIGKIAKPVIQAVPQTGNLLARTVGRIQPETLQRAVQPDSKALDLTREQAQNLLMDTTERIQNTYKDILANKGKNIENAVNNLDATAGVPINILKADLNDVYNSYSKSGDKNFNAAINQASDVYDDIINTLQKGEIPQAQIDKENFIDFYNKMLSGEVNPTQQANILSQTPDIWLQQGIPNQKIATSQNILKKMGSEPNIYDKNHFISADTIRNLPDLLFDPNYILKSNTQSGRYVGVLNAVDEQGRPILGILNPKGGVNFMPSAYGRNDFSKFIKDQEKLGNILYNKGATPSTPTIGVEQGAPITSIADLPKNNNLSATKLYELLHGGMPKIKWDDVNADIKNNILERVYGKYASRLSKLSPELKQANADYAKVKNFQKNEGLNAIINPKNIKDVNANKLDNASTKLRNYNATVTSGNKNRNIQNLEQLFINEGYAPFLNDVDDVNAAMDLLNARSTGDSWLANLTTQLSRPALKAVRELNRRGLPQKLNSLNSFSNKVSPAVRRILTPILIEAGYGNE